MTNQAKVGNTLNVALNGILVGRLQKNANGSINFTYDAAWLSKDDARAISLSLPLRRQTYTGDEVYNFFDNLLPDNTIVRERIQKRFRTKTNQPFDLLSSIGIDCIGAVQLYPDNTELPPVQTVNVTPLDEHQIADLLRGYRDGPLGMFDNIDDFRISLAGAQEKTALLNYQSQWCRPVKSTPTSHIFKLPIGHIAHNNIDLSNSCENEWLCLKIAKEYGLPVTEASLEKFEDQKAIVVKRFDRRWSDDGSWLMRLPQEDFCQALNIPSATKYESDGGPGIKQCMELLLGSDNVKDRETFFYSQIIFWLLAAIDGHAKNFSIYILPNTGYRMTPLYDIMSAYPMLANKQLQRQKVKMAMAVMGENRHYLWDRILSRHFIETAKIVGFSVDLAMDMMKEIKRKTPEVIKTVAKQIPDDFPTAISESIFTGILQQSNKL